MIGYTHAGQWGVSSANSYVEAHLKKDANSSTITLDITKALSKTATMTTSDSTLTASSFSGKCAWIWCTWMTWPLNDHADISGHFHYDSLNTISSGTYVSYSNDRLVFYQNDNTGTTFTGYVRCISFMIISANLIYPDILFSIFVSSSTPAFDHDVDIYTYIANGRSDSATLLGIQGSTELTLSGTVWS